MMNFFSWLQIVTDSLLPIQEISRKMAIRRKQKNDYKNTI